MAPCLARCLATVVALAHGLPVAGVEASGSEWSESVDVVDLGCSVTLEGREG